MIIFIWFFCVVYVVLFVGLNWLVFVFDVGKVICYIKILDCVYRIVWNVIIIVIFVFLLMVILFFCYWRVLKFVCWYNVEMFCLF